MSDEPKKKIKINNRNANNIVATTFCNSEQFERKLVYFIDYDAFFYFTYNRYFKKLDDRDFKKLVLRFCETQFAGQGFTASQIKDIISLVKLKINREVKKEDTSLIAFKDCLYNTKNHKTEEFSINKMVTWDLPYNLGDIKMEIPIFSAFLESSLVEQSDRKTPDFELINLVQEMFGFFMLDSFYATGAFFLYGQGSNGKSVIMDILEMIFGYDYVSGLALSDFKDKFAKIDLINKRLNISRDEDDKYVSTKMFKALVTGESVRAEHKFGDGIKIKPTCKFLFSSNKIPTFDGFDYGLKRRLFIIPFYRKFSPQEQDKYLIEKVVEEIPGIIGWALEGAKRLKANNFVFSKSGASATVFAEFEEEMSGAIAFFNENYVIDDKARTPKGTLYDHYIEWSKTTGKKSYSKRRFMKELVDNIEELDSDLFAHDDNHNSFRAVNCRLSDRDERDVPSDVGDTEIEKAFQDKLIN